jgi:D-erythritol 1-phosphate dehydrogenase
MQQAWLQKKYAAICKANPCSTGVKMEDLGEIDLVVIGGGINGTGVARDAAGRGLSVILCEKNDLSEGTSSRSGKLIHGGLRYLEYYEFRLVREALIEREVLLAAASHIIWPMRFVLPHAPEQRPAWLVQLGLFLYDHLGGRKKLSASRKLNLQTAPEGDCIKDSFKTAFEYSDCWVDDSRLVILNALDAQERGAKILVRTAATKARRNDTTWSVEFRDDRGREMTVRAKALVNAAGPWVEQVIGSVIGLNSSRKIRLVKGSHIIVQKFWKGPQAYVFQNHDKRIIFVNPYQDNLCLIGTTDIPYSGKAEDVAIEQDEINYLLAAVNRYTKKQLTHADILKTYSGVRPLYDDNAENPSAVTRDYVFDVEGQPPLLSVFGGKITTYRKLAEHALQKLKQVFPHMGDNWTAAATLPGGDFINSDFEGFLSNFRKNYPWLSADLSLHYARLYGTRAIQIIKNANSIAELGEHFGHMLYQSEVQYLCDNEWAESADDFLFRRTKFGVKFSAAQLNAVRQFLATHKNTTAIHHAT